MKIVQLGANRGNDHVTSLVKSNGAEFLLLVEPHPEALKLLKECYKDIPCIIEPVAIVSDEVDSITFYYADDPNPNYEVSSLMKSHIQKHGTPDDKILSLVVSCTTLEKLFQKHNIEELDYLFIDIEGVEEDILMSFDFNKYNIKHLRIETLHMKNKNALDVYLGSFGYTQTGTESFDSIYVKGT